MDAAEQQIAALVALTPEMQRLMTLPGVGRILAVVIALEIGNVVCYVTQRYLRRVRRKNHRAALGAVARHLAEAAYHVLQRKENYREPPGCSTRT